MGAFVRKGHSSTSRRRFGGVVDYDWTLDLYGNGMDSAALLLTAAAERLHLVGTSANELNLITIRV